jgi:SAM-dependent methyltransferase
MTAASPLRISSRRLEAFLDAGPPDIGTVWELCMYFEFDQAKTIDGIADWLGPPQGLRVLDCACGSGFPALGLIAKGYDVTCTDGSGLMLEHFRRNARLEGLDVQAHQMLWEELPGRYAGTFDVVLNRGCGNYRYAAAWDDGGLASRAAMAHAIGQWVACIRPGGRFYVDIPREDPPASAPPEITRHPVLLIGNHTVELAERIAVDPESGIRTWTIWLTLDGVGYEFERRAHHIRHEELAGILTGCGLLDVCQIDIPGEYYDIFCAIRPEERQEGRS